MTKILSTYSSGKNLRYNKNEDIWEKESISRSVNDVYHQTEGIYTKNLVSRIKEYENYQKNDFINILKEAHITLPSTCSWDDICETIGNSQLILFSEFLFEMINETQEFTVPLTGDYEIACYGAQGSNTDSYFGGLGGGIVATISLKTSDKIRIVVGGQNGYSDGGFGSISNGGGATWVYLNDELLFVAGGGGGACEDKNGTSGGNSDSSTLLTVSNGGNSSVDYTAGGGGGYYGGMAGIPVYHTHTASCYKYHTHSSACQSSGYRCGSTSWTYKAGYDKSDGTGLYYCNSCGGGAWWTKGSPGSCNNIVGKKTCSIPTSQIVCGKDSTTIDSYTSSYGGSNYENDNLYTECSSYAGVNEGNGYVKIKYCR